MIKTFACKETEKISNGEASNNCPREMQARAMTRLAQIAEITDPLQLRIPPSNRVEKLRGKLKDFWSIRINNQWRIIFKWRDGNAFDVAIEDYH